MATAASGMRARMESLDLLANNLANTATAGYKSDREFYGLYAAAESAGTDRTAGPTEMPVIERHWTDFTQGTLTPTGNPLDLALAGRGLFSVNGPGGVPLYTRNGSFHLSAAGAIVTAEGFAVRSTAGAPITAVSAAPLEIAPDGVVRQSGQVLGQLAIVDFDPSVSLAKQGHSYFRPADPQAAPIAANGTEVHQGKLESSNVSAPEASVRLIAVMRQFEMLQKAMSMGAEMGRKAIEEVARVN